jgi:putative sterol carrier protein
MYSISSLKISKNMSTPQTAKEIILALPERFKADSSTGDSGTFHFNIDGDNGGQFTVTVADGQCAVTEGMQGDADCVISAVDTDFEDAELGRVNKQMAVMMGKIKISNLGAMLKFLSMFNDIEA